MGGQPGTTHNILFYQKNGQGGQCGRQKTKTVYTASLQIQDFSNSLILLNYLNFWVTEAN